MTTPNPTGGRDSTRAEDARYVFSKLDNWIEREDDRGESVQLMALRTMRNVVNGYVKMPSVVDYPEANFLVLSAADAQTRLRDEDRTFDWCLSIGDPDAKPPSSIERTLAHLLLRFHDHDATSLAALSSTTAVTKRLMTAQDMASALAFIDDVTAQPGARGIVHCQAGVSRSPAMAVAIGANAVRFAYPRTGDRAAHAAAALVIAYRACGPRWRWLKPNAHIIALADAHFDMGGALTNACKAHAAAIDRQISTGGIILTEATADFDTNTDNTSTEKQERKS